MCAIDDLMRFRQALVEMRRNSTARAHAALSRADCGELAARITTIQGWIESVDRAIEDEKTLDQNEARLRAPQQAH